MKAPILNDAQWEQAIAATTLMQEPHKYQLMLLLVRKLGLRPMEMAGLHTDWFRGGELRIPLGYSKRKSGRSIPYDAQIERALRLHMQGREGVVFLNQQGEPFLPGGMSAAIARCIQRAVGVGSAYSGRRGAAQGLYDRTGDIVLVQGFLGHSNPMTTLSYVGCSQARLRAALFS